jgi:hypothetical protein
VAIKEGRKCFVGKVTASADPRGAHAGAVAKSEEEDEKVLNFAPDNHPFRVPGVLAEKARQEWDSNFKNRIVSINGEPSNLATVHKQYEQFL